MHRCGTELCQKAKYYRYLVAHYCHKMPPSFGLAVNGSVELWKVPSSILALVVLVDQAQQSSNSRYWSEFIFFILLPIILLCRPCERSAATLWMVPLEPCMLVTSSNTSSALERKYGAAKPHTLDSSRGSVVSLSSLVASNSSFSTGWFLSDLSSLGHLADHPAAMWAIMKHLGGHAGPPFTHLGHFALPS